MLEIHYSMNELPRQKRATAIYLRTSFDGIRFSDQRFPVNSNNNYNIRKVRFIVSILH